MGSAKNRRRRRNSRIFRSGFLLLPVKRVLLLGCRKAGDEGEHVTRVQRDLSVNGVGEMNLGRWISMSRQIGF